MMEASGPNNGIIRLTRELFVGSLFFLTAPLIAADIGMCAFSKSADYFAEFLALRAMILLATYNVICYTLLFTDRTTTPATMVCGLVTLSWSVLGSAFFGSTYVFVSSMYLCMLYSWCFPINKN
jgi:hypothetical protein